MEDMGKIYQCLTATNHKKSQQQCTYFMACTISLNHCFENKAKSKIQTRTVRYTTDDDEDIPLSDEHPSKHALTGPIQDLNGQVRAIRANLSLINPVWDLFGLPVLNPQYHALINPVWDLNVFARMISATTGPYRSCTGSVWVCLNLQQGGSPKRRETHWRRRLAPTLNNNWHRLCFYSLIPR